MSRTRLWLVALVFLACSVPITAQMAGQPEARAHEALRELRRSMVAAIQANDLDALVTHLQKDVVVTFMDGTTCHGPQEVHDYLAKMTRGPNHLVASYQPNVVVDSLTHLYGDTGVAFGHSDYHFVLTDGREFTVTCRWTTTLVKTDGTWRMASFHASGNLFDNPVLSMAMRQVAWVFGGLSGAIGLLLGLLMGWFITRRRLR
jgi:uncharacterized protein (TIGR02246 family)